MIKRYKTGDTYFFYDVLNMHGAFPVCCAEYLSGAFKFVLNRKTPADESTHIDVVKNHIKMHDTVK